MPHEISLGCTFHRHLSRINLLHVELIQIQSLNVQSRLLQNHVKDLSKQYKIASKPKKVKKHTVMHDPVNVSKELKSFE